jgi:AraC-like DNA-binding protein
MQAAANSAAATLRAAPFCALPAVLRELGFDPVAVLGQAGFAPAYFSDPDMPIPYGTATALAMHCAKATDCEHLGLLLTERAGPDTLGLPGLLLTSASDVRTGLRGLVHYMDLHDRGAIVTLHEDGDDAYLGYAIVTEVAGAEQAYDMAMMVGCNLMRSLCGAGWNPSEVLLQRQRPASDAPWRRCFRAPVRFGAARCALKFPASWLALSLPAANPMLHRFLQNEADRLQGLMGKGFVDEVRRLVQGMAARPPCTASHVARLLDVHERTLNRRLQAEGTSFSQLRDGALHTMALQMLGASSMPLADVAMALDYSEASAFIRAFTRWSGQTPDRWRRRNGGSGVVSA